ncbi:MAG: NAD-dependent epimerase/dehydratase family protein, partial [Planctomycetota bacterium]
VAILGASGYVGSALFESLSRQEDITVVPIVRTLGKAWPLIRQGAKIVESDVRDVRQLTDALNGCEVVVNCSLGLSTELVGNIRNIIRAAKTVRATQLIHLSSVTVYGNNPDELAHKEDGPVNAVKNTYGWYKAEQDKLVEKARQAGLHTVVLCLPHVTGRNARFFNKVSTAIRQGKFALVEDGELPCNLVDVDNVCHAIELAISAKKSIQGRVFLTNGDNYTWKALATNASEFFGNNSHDFPRIQRRDVRESSEKPLPLRSVAQKVLSDPETIGQLKRTRLANYRKLLRVLKAVRRMVGSKASATISTSNQQQSSEFDPDLLRQQLRGVRHSICKAQKELNYEPLIDSTRSYSRYAECFRFEHGYDGPFRELYLAINNEQEIHFPLGVNDALDLPTKLPSQDLDSKESPQE